MFYNTSMPKRFPVYIGFMAAVLLVVLNIFTTQNVSPLFSGLVFENQKSAVIGFLRTIKNQPYFKSQLSYFKAVYGEEIESAVFSDTSRRVQLIKQYESLLTHNPKSRNLLIALTTLYLDENNFKKARQYYQKAKSVDPDVYIDKLE